MANTDRNTKYVDSEVLQAIFQGEEDSELKDFDISSKGEDCISEYLDNSNTESLE